MAGKCLLAFIVLCLAIRAWLHSETEIAFDLHAWSETALSEHEAVFLHVTFFLWQIAQAWDCFSRPVIIVRLQSHRI